MPELDGRPTVLAVVPARGGSKRVPRKNIRSLAGKPLICWTIDAALRAATVDRVIVSTDDEEIAAVARSGGADVPFLRPAELSRDETPDLPVCRHVLQWLEQHEQYLPDVVVWLRPTSPLRTPADVDGAVRLLLGTRADSIRSVSLAREHPYWMKRLEGDRLLPVLDGVDERRYFQRQLLPPVYSLNGAVDVTRTARVMADASLFQGDVRGYVMNGVAVDIDDESDFVMAEALLQAARG